MEVMLVVLKAGVTILQTFIYKVHFQLSFDLLLAGLHIVLFQLIINLIPFKI